jgi:hypothetical protein
LPFTLVLLKAHHAYVAHLQHGHQTQESDQEVLNLLKYVRPGNGYEPNFPMFSKLCVNGADEDELFTYLKAALPTVHGACLCLLSPAPLCTARVEWWPIVNVLGGSLLERWMKKAFDVGLR